MHSVVHPIKEIWGPPTWAAVPIEHLQHFLSFLADNLESSYSVMPGNSTDRLLIGEGSKFVRLLADKEQLTSLFKDFVKEEAAFTLDDRYDEANSSQNWQTQLQLLTEASTEWEQFVGLDGTLTLYLD